MRLFPINSNEFKQIQLKEQFEKENNKSTPIGTCKKENEQNNDIMMELVLEKKSKVEDICHLQGYKDTKSCTISFVPKNKKKREIISLATSYALNTLGMEVVFLKINPQDKKTIEYLDESEFECLGDEKGSIIYLKENQY